MVRRETPWSSKRQAECTSLYVLGLLAHHNDSISSIPRFAGLRNRNPGGRHRRHIGFQMQHLSAAVTRAGHQHQARKPAGSPSTARHCLSLSVMLPFSRRGLSLTYELA